MIIYHFFEISLRYPSGKAEALVQGQLRSAADHRPVPACTRGWSPDELWVDTLTLGKDAHTIYMHFFFKTFFLSVKILQLSDLQGDSRGEEALLGRLCDRLQVHE